ncbi:MAG TPA: HEAT repeat domain-containing protein [Verrucomicrobiae bacterium]|nr:HEAT repeat domain-containing protein [Verrucomicrobiae bacterium]
MFWLTTRQLRSGNAKARKKAATDLWKEANPRALGVLADAALTDPDPEVRQVATSALGRLKVPERLDPLVKALRDQDPEVVRSAIFGLRGTSDEKVMLGLLPMLRHPNFTVRTSTAQTIDTVRWTPAAKEERVWFCVAKGWFERAAAVGVEAIPALKLTAETAPVSFAVRAVEVLAKIPDPSVVEFLCKSLHAAEPAVCMAAAESLGKVGGSEAVAALISSLRHAHTQVRAEAACALGILGATEASVSISLMLDDKEWEVRRAAATALGKLNNPETLEPLAKVLDDPDGDVREAAAVALGKTGDRRAVGPLILALKDELGGVRRIAAAGLARIDRDWVSLPETRAAAEKLKVAIQDAEPAVRFFVAQFLVNLGEMSPEALQGFSPEDQLASPAIKRKRMGTNIFVALLQDRDRDVRQAAAEALGTLGGERAKQALKRATGDPDGDVAAAAQMALQVAAESTT